MCVCIYIYSHLQTDCFVVSQLFSMARHTGHFKLGLKPTQLNILLLSQQVTYISLGINKVLCISFHLYKFCLTGYQSVQFIRRAVHYVSASVFNPWKGAYIAGHRQTVSLCVCVYIYIYIYIYIYAKPLYLW